MITENAIVVIGGWNEEENKLNSVECFDFDLNWWVELPPMNKKRDDATAVVKSV